MSDLDGVGANGTVLPNKVLSHVDTSHFAIGVAGRPINGTLIVIPNTSGAVGVLEAERLSAMWRRWRVRIVLHTDGQDHFASTSIQHLSVCIFWGNLTPNLMCYFLSLTARETAKQRYVGAGTGIVTSTIV